LTSSLSAATLLIDGSILNFNGNAQVGAVFLNWQCTQPGAPTPCPASSGNIAVSPSPNSTGTFVIPGGAPPTGIGGNFGFIKNISEAGQPIQNFPFAVLANFITFATAAGVPLPNITLDLYEIPTGTDTPSATCVGITHCTPTNAAYANSHNPGGLSAFNLDYDSTANSTTASFSFFGTVHDNVAGDSPNTANFIGTFSEPVDSTTPDQIVTTISTGGTITSAYGQRGRLTITVVPEPVTLSLVGAGLLGFGVWGRRRRRS
jgi:hypothetical protein